MKKNILLPFSVLFLIVGCNEPEIEDEISSDKSPSQIAKKYQETRPVDNGRGVYAYDSNPPALAMAKDYGATIVGDGLLKDADGLYTIDANFVDMTGACFQKIPNVPSKRADWGVTRGGVSRKSATDFKTDRFASERVKYNEAVIVALSAVKNKVDPAIIHGIISQESGYNPRAENAASKAAGMMQIIPRTQKHLKMNEGDQWNPYKNIFYGTKYFSDEVLPAVKNNIPLALAGYNAGYGFVQWCGYAIPPKHETQDYVRKVTGYANLYNKKSVNNK